MSETATMFGLIVLLAPVVLLSVLGVGSLIERPLSERATSQLVRAATALGFLAALGVLAIMLVEGTRHVTVLTGDWVKVPHYHFSVKFVFDRLSVPLVILTFLLCGIIGSFATRYMHRERGFNRFFTLLAVFILGMVAACLAGTVETLFVGWELVGLSSALLVAFFHERPNPVRNGLRVWIVYRVSDAALLLAAVVMHRMIGEGDFARCLGDDPAHPWPEGVTSATAAQALVVGLLLLVAAAGKSALVPFSGWLPRAMEGPTPSSAVFYGALSVHLGAFLLLRMSPLLVASPVLAVLVVALGLVTAVYAYLAGSVQTDIKSALSFASLAQVGLIVAEIGLGAWIPFLWYVALAHMLGHACLRTLQFVRAPTLLQDYRHLEDAIGSRLERPSVAWVQLAPGRWRGWLYRFALERGYLDAILTNFVAKPFLRLFRWFDRIERRWSEFLAGRPTEKPDKTATEPEAQPQPAETRS
ncbi:MAG: oxidoreductase [Planctomycetia bacterium]|nr:oxidoreductase [Planctomycetia bacterium]